MTVFGSVVVVIVVLNCNSVQYFAVVIATCSFNH